MTDNTTHPTQVTPALIDRLVCGELRGDAYRQALLALEANPAKWRDCALAFLQEQAIEQEMKHLASSNIDWQSPQSGAIRGSKPVALASSSPDRSSALLRNNRVRLAARLASLAALIVLSFGMGWMLSPKNLHLAEGDRSDLIASHANSALQEVSGQSHEANEQHQGQFASDLAKTAPPSGDDEFFRNNVSLIGNLSSQLLPIDQSIPADLRELERQGRIRIESLSALMPIRHDDGTSVLVPVQQLQIVPVVHMY